jgi:hypothetical protein
MINAQFALILVKTCGAVKHVEKHHFMRNAYWLGRSTRAIVQFVENKF